MIDTKESRVCDLEQQLAGKNCEMRHIQQIVMSQQSENNALREKLGNMVSMPRTVTLTSPDGQSRQTWHVSIERTLIQLTHGEKVVLLRLEDDEVMANVRIRKGWTESFRLQLLKGESC